jgi:hypothetical protein
MNTASQLCCPTCGYSRPLPTSVTGGQFNCPNCRTPLVSSSGGNHQDLFELIERDLFTLSAKIAKALKSAKAERIVRDMSQGHSCESLIASLDWSNFEQVERMTLYALCGCCISRIIESIMADGVVQDDEVILANHLCRPMADLFASRFDRYASYSSLTVEKTQEFLDAFQKDGNWYGGSPDSEADIVTGILTGAATVATADQGIIDAYELLFETVAMRILAVDGVTAEEEAALESFRDRTKAVRELIEIHAREYAATNSRSSDHGRSADKAVATATFDTASKALAEINALIGLAEVKKEIQRLMTYLTIHRARQKHGCHDASQGLHFVFAGNPGTGKSTVAKLLCRILFGFGMLSSAKVVECDRRKLLGSAPGESAKKMDAIVQSAMGGVLVINEPNLLLSGRGTAAQGEEAIHALLKRMETGPFSVILAGQTGLMDGLLAANAGLKGRFTRTIAFEDYTVAELCRIFEKFCIENDYSLTSNARAYAFLHFSMVYENREQPFGNARLVKESFENAVSFQGERLSLRAVAASLEKTQQLEGVDITTSSLFEADLRSKDVSQSKWEGECPECHKMQQAGVSNLGRRFTCKCGCSFTFPWWNLVRSSIPGLAERTKAASPQGRFGAF